jgi:HME family heavy-metal exporter
VAALSIRASVLLGRLIHAAEGAVDEPGAAVRMAARERAVPLILSVLATAAVLLPAAVAGARPGLEFLHPLAVTMVGGLASLLLVQGLLLPAFLLARADTKRKPTSHGVAVSADGRPAATVPS